MKAGVSAFFAVAVAFALPIRAGDTSFTIAVISDQQMYVSYEHQKAEGFKIDAADQFIESAFDPKRQ